MSAQLEPATPEWDLLREQIIETEERAVRGINAARDALLEQGRLFAEVAPLGDTRARNQTGELLVQMAKEAGIAAVSARARRDLYVHMLAREHLRTLLDESQDITISWATLYEIVTKAPEPEVYLTRKIKEARTTGQTRLRRDDVRRERGRAVAEQQAPAPASAPRPADAESRPEPAACPPPPAQPGPLDDRQQALGWLERVQFFADKLRAHGRDEELRQARDYIDGLLESFGAESLTPEMFR